jgi:hypothetical protein
VRNQMPPDGWPLRMVITECVTDAWRDNADLFLRCEAMAPLDDVGVKRMRSLLWNDIREQLQRGELVATGCGHGDVRRVTVDRGFFVGAEPDYAADSLTAHGVSYHDVRVLPAAALARQNPAIPVELANWFSAWSREHENASEDETLMMAGRANLPGITRENIRRLRRPADGKPLKRGRKRGKRASDQLR